MFSCSHGKDFVHLFLPLAKQIFFGDSLDNLILVQSYIHINVIKQYILME